MVIGRQIRTDSLLLRGLKNADALKTDKHGNIILGSSQNEANPKSAYIVGTDENGNIVKTAIPKNSNVIGTDTEGKIVIGKLPENTKSAYIVGTDENGKIVKTAIPKNCDFVGTDKNGKIIKSELPNFHDIKQSYINVSETNIYDIIVPTTSLKGNISNEDYDNITEYEYTLICRLNNAVDNEEPLKIKASITTTVITNSNFAQKEILLSTFYAGRVKSNGDLSYVGISKNPIVGTLFGQTYYQQMGSIPLELRITCSDKRAFLQQEDFLINPNGVHKNF